MDTIEKGEAFVDGQGWFDYPVNEDNQEEYEGSNPDNEVESEA